jgi:hypothetical protein
VSSSWVDNVAAEPRVKRPSSEPPHSSAQCSSVEDKLIAILSAPSLQGETAVIAFRRKEAELLAVCATLSPIESMQLARRLERAKEGDAVAAAFGRLIVERRQRIIRFLNDARRRVAVAGAR